MRKARKYICPECHARAGIEITYGYPTVDLVELADKGEAYIGGCCLMEDGPERHCLVCEHEWQIKRRKTRDPWTGFLPPEIGVPLADDQAQRP